MLQNMLAVGAQALVLFLLMAVGFLCGKKKILSQEAITGITSLVIYFSVPCTLIRAFQLELTADTVGELLTALAAAFGCVLLSLLLSFLLIRDRDDSRRRVLILATAFTNCSFMAFPLQTALLGPSGVFYGAAFAVVTPLLFWSVGLAYLAGDARAFRWKQAVLNPGVLGIAAGLAVFLGRITLPSVLNSAVSYLAELSVPLPMVIIGFQLAKTDLRRILQDRMGWLSASLRLLILPLGELGLLHLCGVGGNVLVATMISASAPPATVLAMMAQQQHNPSAPLAAELVTWQTVLSILTMPVVVGLAQLLA